MLEIDLLGPLAVRSDRGDDLTPVGARERTALALMAVASPTTISTERMASELYGDDGGTDPRNAVQAVVSRLRKALGRSAGSLETHGGGYRLVDIVVDCDIVERSLAETTDPATTDRVQRLGEILAHWTGPTLSDVASTETLDAERFRLDEIRSSTQDSLMELRVERCIDGSVIADLEAAAHAEPTRERRWELLMLTLYRSGRQADALRAYQRARQILGEQLGLAPGPALTALEQQIINHDPALGANASAEASTVPQPTLPAGTVTVLLCDVEGSVRKWEAAPDVTAEQIADLHDTWSDAVTTHRGHLIKSTGDGVLAVFDTAANAVHAAVAGQRRHGDAASLRIKVAINTGEASPIDSDYRGPLVNRCARLLELAAGGQTLATATVATLAADGLDRDVTVRSLGVHLLRDVPEPVEVCQVDAPGMASNFPELRSSGPQTLPRLRTQVLGRAPALAELVDRIAETPLITLLGPGGIGKTTLAVAAGWEAAGARHVVFVDLAATNDSASVVSRIAAELAHGDDQRAPSQQIADRLRTNTDLVIIDNAEHVLDAVAELLDEVLRHDLKGSFLVTSRHPLALAGENVVAVPPLQLPPEDADLVATAATPSVTLFLDRLKQANPHHTIAQGLLPVVAHICRRLDGIPLAIELAAGRASVLAIEDIAARLDDQLRLLRQVPATRERRHRSLEAVASWSVEHLDTPTRRLFGLLSVFAGGFGIDGVESTMTHYGLDPLDAIDQLADLSSSSLIRVERGSRFRMLEPLRQVAEAELIAGDDLASARWAHARWVTDVVAAAHSMSGPERARSFAAFDIEGDQLRRAVANVAQHRFEDLVEALAMPAGWWFLTRDPTRGERLMAALLDAFDDETNGLRFAAAAMGWGTAAASHPNEPRSESLMRALAVLDHHDHTDRGLARIVCAFGATQDSDIDRAVELLTEADALLSSDATWERAILDMAVLAFNSLTMLTNLDPPHPLPVVIERGERAAAAFRYLQDDWALGITLGELGRIKQAQGDLEGAEASLLESVELFGDTEYHGLHYILSEIGKLASQRGEHDRSNDYHRQAMELARRDGGDSCIGVTLGAMAHSAEVEGDIDRAIDLYGQALAIDESIAESGVPSAWQQDLDRLTEQRNA